MTKFRGFIAIDIDSFPKLIEFEREIKNSGANVKLVEPKNIHITLKFLGDTEEKREINIAGHSSSSSLVDMLPSHLKAAPESKYIGREIVEVRRLDSIFGNLCKPTNRVYMKIDTQGFESKVLKGAENSLMQIDTVQLEMSLVPLYEGEMLFNEMCMLMTEKGYSLVAIEAGLSNQDTGQLLQVDGIFHRL